MSSSTRQIHRSKPKSKRIKRHTTDTSIEPVKRIRDYILKLKILEINSKLMALRFQIERMADNNGSLSLLESPQKPPMSQEVNEDGVITFKCTTCNATYKQLKRLQTHLQVKHNINVDLDETIVNGTFSPLLASTHEDAVSEDSPKVKKEPDAEKSKSSKKREREPSEDEDDEEELDRYRREKEKRSKLFDNLAEKFEADISDKTMEGAALQAEATIHVGETQMMTDKISQSIKEAEAKVLILEKEVLDDSMEKDDQRVRASLQEQLDLKDNLLSCKESQIIDLTEQLNDLKTKVDVQEKSIKNKKLCSLQDCA